MLRNIIEGRKMEKPMQSLSLCAFLFWAFLLGGCAHPSAPDRADDVTTVDSEETRGCERITAKEISAHGYPPGSGIRNAAKAVTLNVGGDTVVISDRRQTGIHWWTFSGRKMVSAVAYDCQA